MKNYSKALPGIQWLTAAVKTLTFLLAAMFFTLSSCKKNADPLQEPEAGKSYDISFSVKNVSAFISSGGAQISSTEPLSTYITNMDYFVYYADKKIAGSGMQSISRTNAFGTINMKLPAGTYTMVVIGYYVNNAFGQGLSYPDSMTLDGLSLAPLTSYGDTFIKKLTFTVGDGSPASYNMTLERYTAKIEIKTTDLMPYNVSLIQARLSGPYNYFYPWNDTITDLSGVYFVANVVPNRGKDITLSLYFIVANSSEGKPTGNIEIGIYGEGGNLLGTKIIQSQNLHRNQKITLTGKLFDNIGLAQTTQIGINGDWSSITTGTF